MKCPSCATENKDNVLQCKKCGSALVVMWAPTKAWHIRTLSVIYACLIVAFFLLSHLLKPYLREIPPDVTPWLKKSQDMHKK